MNEVPSAMFRKTYAKLREPTVVTANGHVIGRWIPVSASIFAGDPDPRPSPQAQRDELQPDVTKFPAGGVQARQAQRDALLGKINRSK